MLTTLLTMFALSTANAAPKITSMTWLSLGGTSVTSPQNELGIDVAGGLRLYTGKNTAMEIGANLFSTDEGIGGNFARVSGYLYSSAGKKSALYGGGGVGLGGYSEMGVGLQAQGSVGYAFLRRQKVGAFVQGDVTLPLIALDSSDDFSSPMLSLRVGMGLGSKSIAAAR